MKSDEFALSNLDLLRSIAVGLVLVDHILLYLVPGGDNLSRWPFSPLQLGRFGVVLFFVHTSLVLFMSLDRGDAREPFASVARSFYIRRVLRIYPLSVFIVILCIIAHLPSAPNELFRVPGWTGIASNLLLIQNITHSPDISGPMWSLPYEVQMYLALPFLFYATRRSWGWLTVGILWLTSSLLFAFGSGLGLRGVYLLEYVPCFLAGLFAFRLIKQKQLMRWPAWIWPIFILSVAAFFTIVPRQSDNTYALREWTCSLAVAAGLPLFRQIDMRPIVFAVNRIATYSYGIYLTHLPVMWGVRMIGGSWPLATKIGAALILTSLASFVSYRCVEAPCQNWGRRIFRPHGAIAGEYAGQTG